MIWCRPHPGPSHRIKSSVRWTVQRHHHFDASSMPFRPIRTSNWNDANRRWSCDGPLRWTFRLRPACSSSGSEQWPMPNSRACRPKWNEINGTQIVWFSSTYLELCAILCSGNVGCENDIKHSTISPHKKNVRFSRTNFALISIILLPSLLQYHKKTTNKPQWNA